MDTSLLLVVESGFISQLIVNNECRLKANHSYFVRTSGSPQTQLILLLPASPSNGDMIRFVDVGGQITNTCQLVIRAQSNNAIQGDSTGSSIGLSSGTYSSGGEMIVNTPNAAFGLIFCGSESGAPSGQRGWWLMEI
jgi:hypothetical protein